MTPALPIPSDYLDLVSLLRFAVSKRPPDTDLSSADWPHILKQARQHGVDAFLYPWLAEHLPLFFSPKANVALNSAPAAWRALFFESVSRAALRQRQLSEILEAFADARLAVIPLKGAWLSETVYDDPSQRNMSDLDLLVRSEEVDACHTQFRALGYLAKNDALHSTFTYDQAYLHASHPYCVEMHWCFTSDLVPETRVPDIAAIWQRTSEARLFSQPVRQLKPEDQLAHLIQHSVHHAFALPLRGYLDIALLLQKSGDALDPSVLKTAAIDWGIGHCLPFTLGFVSELFAAQPPTALTRLVAASDSDKRALAFRILSTLSPASECSSAIMHVRLKHSSFIARLRLALSRVFMARSFLAHTYPCARSAFGLPLAWLCRVRDLLARHHTEYTVFLRPSSRARQNLTNAEMREELNRLLLGDSKNNR